VAEQPITEPVHELALVHPASGGGVWLWSPQQHTCGAAQAAGDMNCPRQKTPPSNCVGGVPICIPMGKFASAPLLPLPVPLLLPLPLLLPVPPLLPLTEPLLLPPFWPLSGPPFVDEEPHAAAAAMPAATPIGAKKISFSSRMSYGPPD
jgi:hypothetical protein